jgi:hypothetical protein
MPSDAGSQPPLGSVPVFVYDHGWEPPSDAVRHRRPEPPHARRRAEVRQQRVPPRDPARLGVPRARGPRAVIAHHARLWDPRSPGPARACPCRPWSARVLPRRDEPTAASSVVLVLNTRGPEFLYCRVGDSRWSTHTQAYDVGDGELLAPPECTTARKIVISQTAAVDGRFYFQEKGQVLGVIDNAELNYLAARPSIPGMCSNLITAMCSNLVDSSHYI